MIVSDSEGLTVAVRALICGTAAGATPGPWDSCGLQRNAVVSFCCCYRPHPGNGDLPAPESLPYRAERPYSHLCVTLPGAGPPLIPMVTATGDLAADNR